MKENSEILEGIAPSEIPQLLGYNVTSRKDPPRSRSVSPHGDAILAHWRYGLGKSVAFTSDASRRWGARWVPWNQYKRFWTQAVRWCQRRTSASPYQLTLQKGRKENTCEAVLDAQNDAGNFVNFLSPSGVLVAPDLKAKRWPSSRSGRAATARPSPPDAAADMSSTSSTAKEGGPISCAEATSRPTSRNTASSRQRAAPAPIADRTGGRRVAAGLDLFARTSEVTYTSKPIWPFLMLLAFCLSRWTSRCGAWSWAGGTWSRSAPGSFRACRARDPVQEALQGTREEIRARFPWSRRVRARRKSRPRRARRRS